MTYTAIAHHACTRLGNDEYALFPEKLHGFTANAEFETAEQAAAFAAKFPKYIKLRVYKNKVGLNISFYSNDVNKGANETGMKRLNKFLEIAGEPTEWPATAVNHYKSFADFIRYAKA